MFQRTVVLAIGSALALSGCGTIDPKPACRESLGDSYLPLTEQAEWKYSVVDAERDVPLGEKRNAIIEVNGTTVKLEVNGATRPGVRWLTSDGSRYAWLRNLYFDPETKEPASDQYYNPPALRFDASHATEDVWWEVYSKISIDISGCPGWSESLGRGNVDICPPEAIEIEEVEEEWSVLYANEAVANVQQDLERDHRADAIPAGDFRVQCQKRNCPNGGCINGVYCFAPGVGKVYELSSERESLTSVCFPPPNAE